MGFENVLAAFDDLEKLPIDALLKKVGMILMSKVGGSSGILYGGAYIAASKALAGKVEMGWEDICLSLEAMVNDMMERGKAKPGYKTMIDSLYPAAARFPPVSQRGQKRGRYRHYGTQGGSGRCRSYQKHGGGKGARQLSGQQRRRTSGSRRCYHELSA